MPLDINNLPLAFIYAFTFALVLSSIAFLVSLISRIFHKKDSSEIGTKSEISIKKIRTTGEQLDQVYLTSVIIIALIVLSILLITPLYAFNEGFKLADNWPFLVIIITIIFCLLTFIDWTKLRSKRIPQKDMRKF